MRTPLPAPLPPGHPLRVLLAPLALALLLASGGPAPAEDPAPGMDPAPGDEWTAAVAFQTEAKLGGCAVGDLDPTTPGSEIAAVAASGDVFLVRRGPDGWTGERIAKLGGEMIQCAIGDPDPTHAGNELVVVGMLEGEEDSGGKGAVHLVRREGDGWTVEKVGEAEALVHGVAIGEVDGEHAGDEIVTVGFDRRIRVFAWAEGGWKVVSATDLPAPAKTAIVLRGEAVVANTGTDLMGYRLERLEVFPAGESTPSRDAVLMARTVAAVGVAQARLGTDGGRILVACDDGGLRLVEGETVTVLHREEKKLRGAVLADLDPSKEGIEAATTGYGGAVTLLYPPADPEGAWTPVVLWQDAQPLHHLAAGDVDPTTPGPEIVAVGFGGRVLIAARR